MYIINIFLQNIGIKELNIKFHDNEIETLFKKFQHNSSR